ncbi:LysR family transcriptional regulator [Stenotrophomonas sp. Betaine-02u-21]|uniref:LysR family transcriptional regulator n=1 Tax=Stenotrophomonas TaxID=40323 RepID=UPI000C345E89|nr:MULTISPECIES: LysR family transcriptional regulator [Stenotrophomonas]PKH71502.1 LysR family transcriptional regulator [Stenotrophomonas sp. Betaine-02u-21]PKH71858.1 LysR family transcriptional regulator [Stenotrophomonas sp. Betaine-02u-23]PKH96436.1 LysR family transcriptional regulator [Stenotrophomonas sp. Bg11-02]
MDRFDAMRAFARVVETGSFTRAAQTLQLGRTGVTERVQQLEAHLRVRLLNRTTRQVNLTAEGELYYARVVRLLAELDDAEASLSTATAALRGRLRIDVPSPFARLLLVPALPDFHARYPDIELQIGVSDREVDLIGDSVDCVIRGGAPVEQSLVARHIGDLGFGIHASPDYLRRHGRPTHPGELEGPHQLTVGFLRPRTGRTRRFVMQRGAEQIDLQGRHVIAIDDGDAYLAAGLAGLGIVCVPDYMAAAPVARGELVPLFDDWQIEPMPMYLMFSPGRHVNQRLRVFIDWVTALMKA